MTRTLHNARKSISYRGWVLEVSGRGPGRWDVVAGKHGTWYSVGLLDGPVSEAFQLGREWVDARSSIGGRVRGLFSDQPVEDWRRPRRNPCLGLHVHQEGLREVLEALRREERVAERNPSLIPGDRVRLPSGQKGIVESRIRGQVYMRTTDGQLHGFGEDNVVELPEGAADSRIPNPGVPSLRHWTEEEDEFGEPTYHLHVDGCGAFMVWRKGNHWRPVFLSSGGQSINGPRVCRPEDGVEWSRRQALRGSRLVSPDPRKNECDERLPILD